MSRRLPLASRFEILVAVNIARLQNHQRGAERLRNNADKHRAARPRVRVRDLSPETVAVKERRCEARAFCFLCSFCEASKSRVMSPWRAGGRGGGRILNGSQSGLSTAYPQLQTTKRSPEHAANRPRRRTMDRHPSHDGANGFATRPMRMWIRDRCWFEPWGFQWGAARPETHGVVYRSAFCVARKSLPMNPQTRGWMPYATRGAISAQRYCTEGCIFLCICQLSIRLLPPRPPPDCQVCC